MNQKKINYLHLTDLHLGMRNQSHLLPRYKMNLFNDLKISHDLSGPWDIVFFTGDFVQKGSKSEFVEISKLLEEIWGLFEDLGSKPLLLPIPGNHDLERPDSKSPVIKALHNWEQDEEIRNEFWNNSSSEYRKTVEKSLESYSNWFLKQEVVNHTKFVKGLLPGDYSCILNYGGMRLGVIGLNTTFLQLDDSDYLGKLCLSERQFNSVCNDLIEWKKNTDISVLLTHHDQSWLNRESQTQLNSEIAPPGMFHAHFCGHLHEPSTKIERVIGSNSKSVRIGASLFGMEYFNGSTERIHGYSSGTIELNESTLSGSEYIWPRKMAQKYSGAIQLGPDIGYNLNSDNSIFYGFEYTVESKSNEGFDLPKDNTLDVIKKDQSILNLGNKESENYILTDKLKSIPKYKLQRLPHHESIRKIEQSRFESLIRQKKFVWVFSDWGMGFDGFLSSVCSKMELTNNNINIFNLLCEDADTFEDVVKLFKKQFGVGIQEFCQLLSENKKDSILVLNQINRNFKEEDEFNELENLINLILDFCPKTSIVVTTRERIDKINEFVELKILDIPLVKDYMFNHPDSGSELAENIPIIEKLYDHSGGLPMHLDRIIDSLRFNSIEELFEEENNREEYELELSEPIPKALRNSVKFISNKTDKLSKRSFFLLKVLSVLENGETLKSIRKLDYQRPFYTENALQLSKLSLIDSIPITELSPNINSNKKLPDTQKILKVPKQVRDYIKSLITSEELMSILHKSADYLFGPKWREGRMKTNDLSPLSKSRVDKRVGNELVVLRLILIKSIESDSGIDVKRAFLIYYQYCYSLYSNKNFHDCIIGSEKLYKILRNTNFYEELLKISIIYGKAMRMDPNIEEGQGVTLLSEILEDISEKRFDATKTQIADIHLSLALGYSDMKKKKKAIYHAKEVIKLKADSGWTLQAESVLISNQRMSKTDRLRKLRVIERKARRNKSYTTANNIAYELARHHAKDDKDSIRQYNKVIKTENDTLNIILSVIKKAKIYIKNNELSKIKDEDKLMLGFCYTYLYYQRISYNFNECHQVIWEILEGEKNISQLLQVYRHSSFLWRIMGKKEIEKTYLTILADLNLSDFADSEVKTNRLNYEYYKRRSFEFNI